MKGLVNNKSLYDEYLKDLGEEIEIYQKRLEQAVKVEDIYRLQGSIMALRRREKLRERING